MARQSKDDGLYRVTACIVVSKVNLMDKKRRISSASRRISPSVLRLHRRKDQRKWYVIKKKVTKTRTQHHERLWERHCGKPSKVNSVAL
jgi:hypothetical protein